MDISFPRAVASILLSCSVATALAVEPFEVIDVSGAAIGRFGPDTTVQLTVDGQSYMVALEAEKLEGETRPTTTLDFVSTDPYYKTMDCSGPAFGAFTKGYGFPGAIVKSKSSGKVMLHPLMATTQRHFMLTRRDRQGECLYEGARQGIWARLADPIDITALYVRPFTVR